jgi:light-regulated signal transduction histidine kinase (bacteriophytochrome)
MTGFANLLAEDYADCLDATGREYCQHIADSAARMDELINDLLDYSRLGRSELLMQAVSLESAIREAIGQLESEIKERQASVVVEGLLPDVMGHHKMLVQISANLIGNAVKFVAPDVRPKVRIWAERREPLIRLWVEDNGIGIDDECHEQIFRVFERLHGIESYPGTGIGLAIVGRVVSRLGGRYGVESQLGEGSRFWVEFRAAREDDS